MAYLNSTVKIRFLEGNVRNSMLHNYATFYRGLTYFKKLLKHQAICKSWSTQFHLTGAEPQEDSLATHMHLR